MRAVIQRVLEASVRVDGEVLGAIEQGYLVLLGVEEGDTDKDLAYIVDKTVHMRIFEDEAGKMNRSIQDVGGSILAVSQFTLLGDARHGRRPGFTQAARPETANPMYEAYCKALEENGISVQKGRFGADMKVSLINDGPVTMLLDSKKNF